MGYDMYSATDPDEAPDSRHPGTPPTASKSCAAGTPSAGEHRPHPRATQRRRLGHLRGGHAPASASDSNISGERSPCHRRLDFSDAPG